MILYLSDWDKYPNAIVHESTKNKSFVKLAALYKAMGVENHAFLLALTQPELEFVDPHDENLSIDIQRKILIEIYDNPWYFFREVARAPANSGNKANSFRANRANIALYWFFFNHVITILIQPRQTGKSFSTDTLMIYLLNYGCSNTLINMLTRSDILRDQNLLRLKNIQEELPPFINFKTKKDIFNTEEIKLQDPRLSNSYLGNLSNQSPKLANNVGRGFTSPILHVDEACFVPNIDIALTAALMAGNAARASAKESGSHYGTILTTTTGNLNEKESAYIYKLCQKAVYINERLFDAKDNRDLFDLLYKSSNTPDDKIKRAMVNITMSYKQLGYDDNWMMEQLAETMAEGGSADRDLFNKWSAGTSSSPIPKEYIEKINNNIIEPVYTEIVRPYNYILQWYISKDEIQRRKNSGHTFVIGVDTSDGIGKDDIALVIRDSVTGEVVSCGVFNELNLITLAEFFCALLIQYNNSVMIIERKSSGVAIIDYLLQILPSHGINPFKRLFNMVVQNKNDHESIYDYISRISYYNETEISKIKKYVGFNTSGGTGITSRNELYSGTLMHMLKYTAHTLRDAKLCSQLLDLSVKNGRIDHSTGGHDDLVIAGLLSYWFLINGKNLGFYGLDTKILLKRNDILTDEIYSDETQNENDGNVAEELFNDLLDMYRKETNPTILYQLEHKLKYVGNSLKTEYNKNISVGHLVEELKREKRLKSRKLF